jgi:D-arabinose 1-dehydrogenase-like Zn-dependent alcohol dehydrogenase
MEIKAYAIEERGAAATPFTYQRTIGRHDVLVRITHRSVTRGDIQFIDNDWGDTRFPLVPSHEMIGIVEQAGSDVGELRVGERVGIGFQLGACFECAFCLQGTEQFCPRQTVVGVNAFGGLAEHIVVDARFAFRLPSQLESAASCPLMSSGLTVFAAIEYARLPADARVAVVGIGGLGQLALLFLQAMGHRVSAFSRSPEKREAIERLGVEYVDGADAGALASHRGAFDFILSTLNAPFDVDAYLRMLRPEGQLCLVATPLKPLSLTAGLLYDYARRRIYGNYVGSRADADRMLAFAARHGIAAPVTVLPFSDINDVIERIRRREFATAVVLESRDQTVA